MGNTCRTAGMGQDNHSSMGGLTAEREKDLIEDPVFKPIEKDIHDFYDIETKVRKYCVQAIPLNFRIITFAVRLGAGKGAVW